MRVLRLVSVNSVEERILARAHYKLGLDKKIIEAGMFNKKSNAKERKSMLEEILRQEEEAKDLEDDDVPNDKQINEMLARSRDEFELFQKMDKERAEKERAEAKRLGLKEPKPRLMTDEELPEWLRVDHINIEEDIGDYGRGHRRKAAPVSYDDGLTESQWEKLLEEGGDEQDIAEMREKNLSRKAKRVAEAALEEDDEEAEQPPRKRNRRESTAPPPARGRDKKPRKGSAMQEKMKRIWEAIATSREAETGRQRSKLFMRLPSKKLYPDYFEIIKRPISLNNIKSNIEKGGYNPQLFKEEFNLIFDNAQHYNIPDSEVYHDAVFLQKLFNGHWDQNFGPNAQAHEDENEQEAPEPTETMSEDSRIDDEEEDFEVGGKRGTRKSGGKGKTASGKRVSPKGNERSGDGKRKQRRKSGADGDGEVADDANGETMAVFGDEAGEASPARRSSAKRVSSSSQKLTIRLRPPTEDDNSRRKRTTTIPEGEDGDQGEVVGVEEEIIEEVIEEIVEDDEEYDADQVDVDFDE